MIAGIHTQLKQSDPRSAKAYRRSLIELMIDPESPLWDEDPCALENLLASAAYAKEKYGIKVRLNTNGLANLYHKRNIVPELAGVIDSVSISLNAPDAEKYQKVTRPQFENAFPAMLEFASLAQEAFAHTQLSIVDVLPREEIEACQKIADDRGIYLKIRKFS